MSALIGQFLPGNQLTLLNSGREYFPALIAAIDAAKRDIFLETYIFADDVCGRALATELCNAVRRNVTVRVLVDGFGGRDFEDSLMQNLLDEGVQVMIYRPEIARLSLRRSRLRRLHRKIVLVDDRIAFVGGINIIDDLNTPRQIPPRLDYAVHIQGPLVEPIAHTVRKQWEIVVWANFQRRFRLAKPRKPRALAKGGEQTAAFLLRDNFRHRRDIEEAYLTAIHAARKEILIANAYFLPGRSFRAALLAAAMRGVRVSILLQGCVEYRFLHFATQALYDEFLGAGIHVFEYDRSFLHTKVATIDDEWATVGSSNIDPFSLLLAKEANIVVRDAFFSRELRESLESMMEEGASELEPRRWQRRSWILRVLQWTTYYLGRLAVSVAGYGGRH